MIFGICLVIAAIGIRWVLKKFEETTEDKIKSKR